MDSVCPRLNAGIYGYFPVDTDIQTLKTNMPTGTILRVLENEIEAVVIEVEDCFDWEIDTVLTQLFSLCDVVHLERIMHQYAGKIHIGVWYYSSNETAPALVFEGKNMEIIHRLKADLSIDPY